MVCTMEEIVAYMKKLAAEGQYDPSVDQLFHHSQIQVPNESIGKN